MPLEELHRQVAVIVLRAAAGYGFALGGGNALIQHGVISRPTQDVDLFTDHEGGVQAAAGAVEAALREAGFRAERQDDTAGLAEVLPGMGEGLAEWIITAPGGEQLAYFDRAREPVITDVGPVLDLEDAVGGKVAALASRAYERDYLDTAAALGRYSPAELIGFARRLDPGLEGQDFAEAGQRLDAMPDYAFTSSGLSQQDVARLRERFAVWPRDAGAVAAEDPSRHLDQARDEPASAAAEDTGQPRKHRDIRHAEPDEPEIEP
jgi:hypothetical protein